MNTSEVSQRTVAAGRWPAIDAARGIAIAAMVTYHFSWDLSFLRLIATDIIEHPGWRLFARTIAASFLILVGVGLVLADRQGIRWTSFMKRLAIITAAALAITVVTWFVFPDEYIFFGILHCIALSSVLALPFLRAPVLVSLVAAAFCFAAPKLFTAPSLDAPALDWLGLGAQAPVTNDYVPIFPWFGFVLVGVVAGRLVLPLAASIPSPPWIWKFPVSRALIWSGRYSLLIYLVHQPVLFGGLFLLAQATGPSPAAEHAAFMKNCEASCAQSHRGEEALCQAGCACAAEKLKAEGLWGNGLTGRGDPAERERVASAARLCFAGVNGTRR